MLHMMTVTTRTTITEVIAEHGESAHGGEDPGCVAVFWAEQGFTATEVDAWLNAGCFADDAAAALRDANLAPSDVADTLDIPGNPCNGRTIGYAVANGDLSITVAHRIACEVTLLFSAASDYHAHADGPDAYADEFSSREIEHIERWATARGFVAVGFVAESDQAQHVNATHGGAWHQSGVGPDHNRRFFEVPDCRDESDVCPDGLYPGFLS